ncbi:MAG: proton-conducting transporter membrane subunit, partial [Vampirovibrionia bacterium]
MDWTELIKNAYNYVWIIPLLPLLAFMLIIVDKICERLSYKQLFSDNKIVASIVVGSTAFGLLQAILLFIGSINNFPALEMNYTWLNAGNLTLSFGWMVDNLAITMMLIVTSISMLIQIYTHGYMKHDPGYRLFYGYLALFNFSMLGLVLSTNLFQIYIFWELVGVSSYLLIGFWLHKPSAAKAAKKAFIVNRIGDSLFLIGILGFLYFSYTYWVNSNFAFLSFNHLIEAVDQALYTAGPVIFAAIAICLFFGAVAKSAQFPLHTWLPDAMEGPTPISALIHAATMVAAGVFLVARCYPIFVASPVTMNFIAWIGAITVFIGATIALTQFDIKRVLAYSTISQLGYMMFAMGMGAYSAGLFHLTTHAYFKALRSE